MFIHVDPNSRVAKVILVLGLPMFVTVLWIQSVGFSRAYRSLRWPATDGVIVESRVEREWGIHGPHSTAKIRYAYVVPGNKFENDTIAFGLVRGMLTWGYSDREVQRFPKGRAIDVFYDPGHPEVSCLERGGLGWEDCFMLVVSGGGIVMGMKHLWNFARRLLKALDPFGNALTTDH